MSNCNVFGLNATVVAGQACGQARAVRGPGLARAAHGPITCAHDTDRQSLSYYYNIDCGLVVLVLTCIYYPVLS